MNDNYDQIKNKKKKAKKMMLWFGIISLIMTFGGLTSAFIVSSSREDWLYNFPIPNSFSYSTVVIIISSFTMIFAKFFFKKGESFLKQILLVVTFILGLSFIFLQLSAFEDYIALGYNFTGPTSNVTVSYIYIIAILHIVHVVVGLISLIIVIVNNFNNRYQVSNMLGFELASTFWHFVDFLWLYLFFFFFFFNKIN